MKVYLNPSFDKPDKGDGGIRRVVEAQRKYLPEFGVEFVDTPEEADVANCHATSFVDHDTLVLSLHGLYWAEYDWPKWYLQVNESLIKSMKSAKAVTAPSEWVANAVRRGMLIDPVVCYHGIDVEDWTPGKNKNYVLWNKNRVDTVCDPAPMNRLAFLDSSVPFVSTFGEKTSNVTLTGKLSYEKMKSYIQNAGVYLATSRETLGVGTLEAMACATPVLGWNYGGQREIVRHGVTGYLAEYGNYDDLLDGLHYCLDHQDELGANARQDVLENWRWEHVIQGYLRAYQQALAIDYGPTVSVVVTAYNLDQYLPDALQSVKDQKFKDWECIVVNDNSPDTCGAIAEAFAQEDDRFKVIHNPKNVYLAEARNIGIQNSTGKYVIPLDADDMLGDDALGRLVRALDQNPQLDIVTGSMELIEENGHRWVSKWPNAKTVSFSEQIKKRNQIPYASLYRREVWERTGGYRRRMRSAEDADFWTRAFSYGFIPSKVTEAPTLIYRNRSSSMSHTESEPNWISWFTWAAYEHLVPFGVGGPVWSYGPPLISVVIPVGPLHVPFLQDALDSLIGQTLKEWECIVVNDTGKTLTLPGFPFVKIVDGGKQGTAHARNVGFEHASCERVVLLDADDYMQPHMLMTLYQASLETDGYLYSDWWADDGEKVYREHAKSWDPEQLKLQSLGPVIGLYWKEDWKKVGGFSEDAPGWEDWDFHLKLLENCICGSRIPHPLFTYRYRLGLNRDKDFANKKTLLKYITGQHKDLYGGRMGCQGCSKRNDLIVKEAKRTLVSSNDEQITVEYIGSGLNKRRIPSHVRRGHYYTYSATQRIFDIYKAEADRFLSRPSEFRVHRETIQNEIPPADEPVIVAEKVVVPPRSIENLDIDGDLIARLRKEGITTIEQLRLMNDGSLLKIRGIGPSRLAAIREALNV